MFDEKVRKRFFVKVNYENGCWTWTAGLHPQGYGIFKICGRTFLAHRVAFTMLRGVIPEGLCIDHLCRNRRCVFPEHLEPTSLRENILRGESIPAKNRHKEVCLNGHPLSGSNVRIVNQERKYRACFECSRVHKRAYKMKQKTAPGSMPQLSVLNVV